MRVSSADGTQVLLAQALHPQDQSTSFFALLGVLVGVLLVATAMMLTMPDRRREIAALRLQGYSRRQLTTIVLFQAMVLGAISSFVGVLAGYGLATGVFRANPNYLASAFPLGSQTIVSIPLIVGVWVGGLMITCLCMGPVLLDLRATRFAYQSDGEGTRTIRASTQQRMLAAACILLAASLVTVFVSASLIAALLLAGALLLAVPMWLAGTVRIAERVGVRRNLLMVATGSVRASQVRSIALAATAAIGVFGAVVAEGAHSDLLRGLEGGYARYVDSADLWVTSPSDELATNPFPAKDLAARIAKVSGVTGVRPYYGGWVDMAGRRAWLISSSNPRGVPDGQIVRGSASVAARHLREGGWVALSDQFARALNAHIGSIVSIPTPVGARSFKLAATTTNLGWSSGVIFLPSRDYTQYWGASTPTAFEIDSTQTSGLVSSIQRIAGPGLTVQTSAQRAITADALPRQGLERLSLIAILLVIAATVAIALALGASIWQRRAELASLRLQSFTSKQVQAILAWEVTLVIGAGVLLGALAGMYGHIAADRYLRFTTGYPVVWAPGGLVILGVVLLVGLITAIMLAAPGCIAARAPQRLALDGR
jgi:putative ABC transport system permease protein